MGKTEAAAGREISMVTEPVKWIEPEAALAEENGAGPVLSPSQAESWRERGFALVNGVLPDSLVMDARRVIDELLPAAGSEGTGRYFGSGGRLVFPTGFPSLDEITLHPRLLASVAQLLSVEVRDLRLTQSDVWAKYGHGQKDGNELSNDDQRIHMDYPNHYLTHPPSWYEPEAVEMILYFDDVESCDGATALVPREGREDPAYALPYASMPGVGGLRWLNDRDAAEAELAREAPEIAEFRMRHLYSREARAHFGPGTILFYRHDLWHRGTWLREGTRRIAENLCFRRADSEWISTLHPGWAWSMYRPDQAVEKLVAQATVEQRCVLGFPPPGHAHWSSERLEAVRARYGPLGMDMTPYEKS